MVEKVKLKKLRMPEKRNRRNVIFGLLLIVLSVAGVWFVIETNDKTEDYLVAAKPASSGSKITADSFRIAHFNLSTSSNLYLRPGQVPLGSYLLTTVDAGQLIAKGSVATSIIDARQPVIISSTMPVPDSLKVGDFVDVWVSAAIENNKFAPSVMLVRDAEVADITQPSGVIAEQAPRIQVLVPVVSVAPILDAISSKGALSLVLKRNLGND